ncbi:MAG TPA: DUF6587 family protein [Lysobacter sp.]
MEAGLALQYAVVALAVLASLAYVLRTRFPQSVRRVRGWLAIRLIDSGSPRLSRLGRRLAPAPHGGSGCDSGCSGCG